MQEEVAHKSKYSFINKFQNYLGEFVYGGVDGSVECLNHFDHYFNNEIMRINWKI